MISYLISAVISTSQADILKARMDTVCSQLRATNLTQEQASKVAWECFEASMVYMNYLQANDIEEFHRYIEQENEKIRVFLRSRQNVR